MRRLPHVTVSLSSEDSESVPLPFFAGEWSAFGLSSIPSIPFSEYSHPPYGDHSVGLSSATGATPLSPYRPRGSVPQTTPTPTRAASTAMRTVTTATAAAGVGTAVNSRQQSGGQAAINDIPRHEPTPSSSGARGPGHGRAQSTREIGTFQTTEDGNPSQTQNIFPNIRVTPKPLFPTHEEKDSKKTVRETTQATTTTQHSGEGGETTTKKGLPLLSDSASKSISVHNSGTVAKDSDGEKGSNDVGRNPFLPLTNKPLRRASLSRMQPKRRSVTTFSTADMTNPAKQVTNDEKVDMENTVSHLKSFGSNVASPHSNVLSGSEKSIHGKILVTTFVESQENTAKNTTNIPSSTHTMLKKEVKSLASQPIIVSKENKNEDVEHSVNRKPSQKTYPKTNLPKTSVTIKNMPSKRNETVNVNSSASSGAQNNLIAPYRSTSSEHLVKVVSNITDPELLLLIHDYASTYSQDPRSSAIMNACDSVLKKIKENSKKNNDKGETIKDQHLLDDEDNIEDEFDDYNIKNYPFPVNLLRGKYSFATPTKQGKTSTVFKTGMLYKILTDKGEYFFFNDTLQYVMVIRVPVRLVGNEVINEKAVLSPMDNGETEITLAVLPEDTMFLIKGISVLPRVRAKGVFPPVDFIAPSVKETMTEVASAIEKVRAAMGEWSPARDQKSFLRCCMSNNLPFTDLDFRPSAFSLFRPGIDIFKIPPLTWRRPLDYLPVTELSQVRLFRQNISCHLVRQGNLEDHTVIAGIAAVAMFPEHVRWMFRHPVTFEVGKRERAVGAYRVTLCIGGWWKTLLLDDYFPASLKEPLFAHCPQDPRRLWVSFLEKAYAKTLGSYSALCTADALDVLTDFTGYPCRLLDELWAASVEKPEVSKSLFNYINRCVKRDFIIMVYTPSPRATTTSSVDLSKKLSLRYIGSAESMPLFLPGHVYFITETLYFDDLDLRMVRLKNPWTWRSYGKRSNEKTWKKSKWFEQPENSSSMVGGSTLLQTKRDSFSSCNDEQLGTMLLEWSEALTTFAGGGVCYTLWDWHDYRIKNCFRNGIPDVVLEVTVKKRVEAFLTLSQESNLRNSDNHRKNSNKNNDEGNNYDAILLLVSRYMTMTKTQSVVCKSSNDLEVLSGKLTYHNVRDISLRCFFEPAYSPFYVFPRVHEDYIRKESPFVLSLICDTEVGGSEVQVRFCHFNSSCEVFKNILSFNVTPEMFTPTTASYQKRATTGAPSFKGNCIKK
ncbi:putative calpain-like cysteine peptidase [Trypanosoma theileri]|uniref:Putative calpain-like cysteine peptidase n=1 Tax=Trypanosoma theileri TaxID=67003 RepID=A0A1X0NJ19_9TRYP|nr:putative calpain-like cysteine peptidase [Trypanosoma theileri]ORC84764.1 putative calpain-like cysteine peptidase [Trypanosoma theileri]